MLRRLFLYSLTLLIVAGCDSKPEEPVVTSQQQTPAALTRTQLFSEPIEATLVETATAALPTWRKSRHELPTLVLLSNNPFLQTIPAPLQKEADRLVLSADQAEFEKKSVYQSADPVLMPPMAVSAALQAKLFNQVIWVLPLAAEIPINASAIGPQLLTAGDISEAEAKTLKQEGETLSGQIRNTPWTICRIDSLPALDGPVVLHIDLSYIKALYKTEITTPVYTILGKIGRKLQEAQWQAVAATVSTSNLSGDISLKTRFLGKDMVSMLANPDLLDAEAIPELWNQRSKVLYLDNLFQPEKILDIYLELEKHYPESASIKYGLFDISGQLKAPDKALQYLSEAVATDPIYGLEYLNLSERAFNQGKIQAAMDMLNKASETFPDNPFITLKKVGLYKETGGMALAAPLIEELQQLSWSKVYDPNMADFLATLAEEAKKAQEQVPEK
jgi:tetratricopeptide (TPR) repeat protein